MTRSALLIGLVICWPALSVAADNPPEKDTAALLRSLDANVYPRDDESARERARMLSRDVRSRLQAASLRENRAWQQVKDRAGWEKFRDARLQALRASLGQFPDPPKDLQVRVTRTLEGDGYHIENLVYETRPGLVATANLYLPAKPIRAMPGILIAHSHHNPNTQGELQDMGMTWARQGCMVLIPELLGHGERRQHPFRSSKDYERPFRVGRQDYYFRYNTGLQLHLIGDSLMGWMVWDLRRSLDLLLSRPGVDKERILLLGAVAGGGDPAAVMAAFDPRVKAVAPFNFGGPQPDYAIPANAERDFYFFSVADWESTRCLRLGARDGFAHWLIVGSVAPRPLIYAHEFAWDRERDPVWPRLQKIFGWYNAADHLAATFGKGSVKGRPPESSHCNNIGPLHRSKIYPLLQRWFDMPIPQEYSKRRTPDELLCLTPEAIKAFHPRPMYELAAEIGARRAAEARHRLAGLSPEEQRKQLRQSWVRLLGDVEPKVDPKVREPKTRTLGGLTVERLALEVESDIVVPLVLLTPPSKRGKRPPVVLGLAQGGKQGFLKHRAEAIAELLAGGAAVCLLDVRGTGETQPTGDSRRHTGSSTALSATEALLGQTLLGSRLRDVRSALRYLRGRGDLDARHLALWGDSFAPVNPKDRNLAVPLEVDPFPNVAEPLGGLLALFGALFEDDVRAVHVRGGLASYDSLLHSPFCYVPHDALVPGALTAGDLSDVAAALAPRPLRLQGLVDGLNHEVSAETAAKIYEPARNAYRSRKVGAYLQVAGDKREAESAGHWLLRRLTGERGAE
ncbi:MAG TPA: dienelactone hydrolase family protein [Gemmataceae bacterium]|nr:dienelactone hydrolase family protein [Gemmataceae bacterium]